MAPIVVIGSINMDLVCRTPGIPKPGETILGSEFVTIPGGKGANQAVAAARLGGEVHMVGRVGDDAFGQRLRDGLAQHGVNVDHVRTSDRVASGVAMILVDKKGENCIVVVPGANHKLAPADIDAAEPIISKAAAVVLQLEVPFETVTHAIAMCQRLGIFTILDPAPAPPGKLPRAMYGVDVFTPNQNEAEQLLGMSNHSHVQRKVVGDAKQIGIDLMSRGAQTVVLKLGAKGSMILSRDGEISRIKPFKVTTVDTTAAGDAFTGALAVGRAEGMNLLDSVRFANAAGAVCCQTFGAQPALPTRAEVTMLMARK